MQYIVYLMVSLFFVASIPFVSTAADVNINIGVPLQPAPPPGVPPEAPPYEEFAEPPDVVAVPSGTTTVYMVPNTVGLYFYDGYWWRFNEGYWYRSTIYSGPWVYVDPVIVPRVVVDVPPEYVYVLPPRYHRIHYHDFHSHWREWDRSRHWHRYDWYRNELRDDIRRDRHRHIERDREKWRHNKDHRPPDVRDGHRPRGDGHKPPPGDLHKPRGDGHKPPPGDLHKPRGDGRKPPPGVERQEHQQYDER